MPTRRTIARWGAAALPLMAGLGRAYAGAYPERTIKVVVGFPAGQSTDASARRITQFMSEALKQSVYVDNKPGAAGILSHEFVKNAPNDGYTLLMSSSGPLVINPALYSKLPYNTLRDFEPVALVGASPLVMFTAAGSTLNSFKDLISLARSKPGKLTYGSSGSGTTGHIAFEMLKKAADIDLLHVPYKGSPQMITDIVGGQVDVAFDTGGSVFPLARSGRVKMLAVSSRNRFAAVPDLLTLAEQGIAGFEATAWSALVAPKGTPPEAIKLLNEAVNKALKEPSVIESFKVAGSYVTGGTAAEFHDFLVKEIARWGAAVKASGAQVD